MNRNGRTASRPAWDRSADSSQFVLSEPRASLRIFIVLTAGMKENLAWAGFARSGATTPSGGRREPR